MQTDNDFRIWKWPQTTIKFPCGSMSHWKIDIISTSLCKHANKYRLKTDRIPNNSRPQKPEDADGLCSGTSVTIAKFYQPSRHARAMRTKNGCISKRHFREKYRWKTQLVQDSNVETFDVIVASASRHLELLQKSLCCVALCLYNLADRLK